MNKIYVDIDLTICFYEDWKGDYSEAEPNHENISKINHWTARGSTSGNDYYDLTKKQLDSWGCKYHKLSTGEKPYYDLLICDKTKRIEEI